MKVYPQIQEFISVLLIFILLTYLTGCTSTKIISKSDLPLPDSSKYTYIVHREKSKLILEKGSTISNGTLSGTINQMDRSYHAKEKIHLYLSSDSIVKIDSENNLTIPINSITKVKISKISVGKTILLAIGCTMIILSAFGVEGLLMGNINYLPHGI